MPGALTTAVLCTRVHIHCTYMYMICAGWIFPITYIVHCTINYVYDVHLYITGVKLMTACSMTNGAYKCKRMSGLVTIACTIFITTVYTLYVYMYM